MKLKRSVSVVSMLFASISAIIGSGWLFSSYYAVTYAGPAAILAWIVSGILILVIAFVFGEICSLVPVSGFSARAPQYTHGTAVGFILSWIVWISYTAMTPTETQAVIQYINYYYPHLVYENNALTIKGYELAVVIMLFISVINTYSLRWLMRCNNLLTVFKIIIPVFISLALLMKHFNLENIFAPTGSSFIPFGFKGVFVAVASGGIVFAFNGFKQAAEMAGETKKPYIALPVSLIGSIVICLVVYLLLQVAFISSLTPDKFIHGWNNLGLSSTTSPLASIIAERNENWLLPILYSCAILAPLAAGMMYCNSAGRSLYGMSKNKYIPSIFQKINTHNNPTYAIIANFFVGMLMFAPFNGWNNMVAFLSSIMTVTYAMGPITLLALREQLPTHSRPFKLPFGYLWSIIAFYFCTLLTYWCGWNIIYKLDIAILAGTIILIIYQQVSKIIRHKNINLDWRSSIWMFIYFGGLGMLSYYGSFGGGLNLIPFGLDFILIGVFSVFIIYLSLKFKLNSKKTLDYITELKEEVDTQQ